MDGRAAGAETGSEGNRGIGAAKKKTVTVKRVIVEEFAKLGVNVTLVEH